MIPVYTPDVQVWLHKTVQRKTTNGKDAVSQRFTGSAERLKIDLRPFLGEGSQVQTQKSVRDPAGGFAITLVDKPDGDAGSFESLYGLIEPMDMIEIRARHGTPTDPQKAPIVMRGFVSDVQRVESAGGDGRPARGVMVSGQDYGKIWQIIQINYLAGYLVGKSYISGFPLFEQYGIPTTTMSPAEFVRQVLDKIINPYLKELMPEDTTLLPRTVGADITVADATVSPGIQTHQGTIYEMLRFYGDVGPWNELFMDDREDTVFAVYRPNPYLKTDGTGEKIQSEAPDPVYVDVPITDVVQINVSRGDSNVANFYWVSNQRFNLVADVYQRQAAVAAGGTNVDLSAYANSNVKLYGIRMMQMETQQGGPSMSTHNTGGASADVDKLGSAAASWMDRRRQIVVDSNRDNIVLEHGTMRMRGNEAIKAGTYIRLTRGSLVSTYYVVQVSHDFTPFQAFTTTVQVERGTGFIERIKSSGSPYWQERTT